MVFKAKIIGSGRAGHAIAGALSFLKTSDPELGIGEIEWIKRGEPLKADAGVDSLLFVANPHGLHAKTILEADRAGFKGIASEKPVCVTVDQAKSLENVKAKCAVYHVYRQMWGPQTLKEILSSGELGELVTIEGRYWQASTAERALNPTPQPNAWKNDIALSGPSDALLDVGTHWADMAIYLAGEFPQKMHGWSSYKNSESPHRDSHVHLNMEFDRDVRGFCSISKNIHGATNIFEMHLLGTKGSASWSFLQPDEIFLGKGRQRRVMTRTTTELGSHHPPFHGMGWTEGYLEITRQWLRDLGDKTGSTASKNYPNLRESARLVEALLTAKILRSF